MPSAKENGWKNFFGSRVFVLVAGVVAVLVALGYGRAYYQDYLVRQEIDALREQADKLRTKKVELLEVLKYVKSDSFVEEKARTELNMVKPGEQILVLPPTAAGEDRQEKNNMLEFSNISNYKKWWRYFFPNNVYR